MPATATLLKWFSNADNSGYHAYGNNGHTYSILKHGSRFRYASGADKEPTGTYKALKAVAQADEDARNADAPPVRDSRNVPSDTDLRDMARELASEEAGPETGAAAVALAKEHAEEVAAGRGEQCDLYPEAPAPKPTISRRAFADDEFGQAAFDMQAKPVTRCPRCHSANVVGTGANARCGNSPCTWTRNGMPPADPTANGATPRNGQHRAPTIGEDEADRMGAPASPPAPHAKPARVLNPIEALMAADDPEAGAAIQARKATEAAAEPPHLVVEALAGTGKTTTLICAIQVMKGIDPHNEYEVDELGDDGLPTGRKFKNRVTIVPSPQQKAVWDSLALSRDAGTVGFLAFNKAIATELQKRVPVGCEALTNHSLGFRAVNRAYKGLKVTEYRVSDIIGRVLNRDTRDLRREKPVVFEAVQKLVSLCKGNLTGLARVMPADEAGADYTKWQAEWAADLDELCDHYDIDVTDEKRSWKEEVYHLVPRVLDRCRDPRHDMALDFDDMVWLPVALDLAVTKYDVLLVDEAQDLNRCQQELIKRAGRRIVLCGDRNQAIYGFAGADSESLPRMTRELGKTARGVEVLPLTVTRRCGRRIVREAQRYVPEFEAHESNPDGEVRRSFLKVSEGSVTKDYRAAVRDGDMVICRTNAPLVSEVFKFIKAGRRANIQGRDIGKGLSALVRKSGAETVKALLEWLPNWVDAEVEKENAKKNPSPGRHQAITDRYECLVCFTADLAPGDAIEKLHGKIESVFTEDKKAPGIRLSSIHKAKGLEAEHVFFIEPKEGGYAGGGQRAWMEQQEGNLRYVAITRAVKVLTYVS